jgi:hypothetical protein
MRVVYHIEPDAFFPRQYLQGDGYGVRRRPRASASAHVFLWAQPGFINDLEQNI